MPKSNARKTADAIHNIPEYYGPQPDEPTDGMKKGDIWFESDGSLGRQSTLKKKSRTLPARTKSLKKLRRK